MRRGRRLLVAAHCVLNQNAVVAGEARSEGAFGAALEWAVAEGYGIVQLPCPELAFLGHDRPPMTVEDYDTEEFHDCARRLLEPVVELLLGYRDHGCEIAGVLGIEESPSCDPVRGNFMRDFRAMAAAAGLELGEFRQIPSAEDGRFDPEDPRTRPAGSPGLSR